MPSWALVSWRPGDDWLLRAGRARAPLYLHSESMDVGVTHDMARLPTELYSLAPTTDVDGLYLTRTWPSAARPDREVSLDAYSGQRDTTARFWRRDGLPPAVAAGAAFIDVNVRLSGLALTLRQSDLLLRTSMHRVRTRQLDGTSIPVTFPYVELMPGLGYYQVSNALPGPGLQTVRTIGNTIYSLGAEVQLNPQWRASGEYVRNRQDDTEFASDTTSWQLALFHPMGRLTPYASLARLTSRRSALDWYDRLTKSPLPATLPGARQINAAQRLAAESIWVADQRSLALGASYALNPGLKLKGEWMRTHIGRVSRLVDTPPGSESPHDTSIDVLTVNLNSPRLISKPRS